MDIDRITETVIGSAIEVHKALGPGLLESTYEECLFYELDLRQLCVYRQVELPVVYKGAVLNTGYKLDLLFENKVVVELKAVDKLMPIHEAQLLTYMKLVDCTAGLLINFNVPVLRQGVRRKVLNYAE